MCLRSPPKQLDRLPIRHNPLRIHITHRAPRQHRHRLRRLRQPALQGPQNKPRRRRPLARRNTGMLHRPQQIARREIRRIRAAEKIINRRAAGPGIDRQPGPTRQKRFRDKFPGKDHAIARHDLPLPPAFQNNGLHPVEPQDFHQLRPSPHRHTQHMPRHPIPRPAAPEYAPRARSSRPALSRHGAPSAARKTPPARYRSPPACRNEICPACTIS